MNSGTSLEVRNSSTPEDKPMYLVLGHALVRFVSGTVWDWRCRLCGTDNSDSDDTCWCGGRKR